MQIGMKKYFWLIIILMFSCGTVQAGDGIDDLAGLSRGQVYYTTDKYFWDNIPYALTHLVSGDFNGDGLDDLAGL
ncbi:MAG: hypothetical protein GY868_03010, partial [Deltaproteobacteria bacterium]|nr:hypothetical protein [Deltaproteobacteria bacterium]